MRTTCKKGLHQYAGVKKKCPDCRRDRDREKNTASHRAKKAEQLRLRKYGLSAGEPEAMLAAQGNMCANKGCEATEPGHRWGWHIDHCHRTGKIRAILCHHCNLTLGQSKESKSRLLGLVLYLETHCEQ